MKNTLLVSFLFFFSFQIQAQVEFAPVGATWYYEIQHFFGSPFLANVVQCIGDTIVNGQNCRLLKSDYNVCNSLHDWGDEYYIYTENEKVYSFNHYNNEFVLWYDFNAIAGDEWEVPISYFQDHWDTLHVRVDSIDLFAVNGTDR